MATYTAVFSGPQGKRPAVAKALEAAGFSVRLDENGSPLAHSWTYPASAETTWTGKRWTQDDIDALPTAGCTCHPRRPTHKHAVGDIVRGSGSFVPKEVKQPVAFLTVDGDDIDVAKVAAVDAGWRLRGFWKSEQNLRVDDLGPGKRPTSEQRIARAEQALVEAAKQLAALKGSQ